MQSKSKNISLIIFSLIFVFTFLFLSESSVSAWWYLDSEGVLQYETFGSILGDDNSGSGSSGVGSSDSSSDERDDSDDNTAASNDEDDEEELKLETETFSQDGTRTRIRIERKDGRLRIRRSIELENGEELDDEDGTDEGGIFEIREHRNKTRIRIATGSGDFIYFIRGNSSARTSFPLSINTETNELIVTTPAGIKVVTILPDQAVANMLAQNVLDEVDEPEPDQLPDENVGEIEDSIELEEEDGVLVYKIKGFKRQRILGIFDVAIDRTAVVSAETGELISTEQSFLQRLLDLISF